MTISLRYTGAAQSYSELAVTGKQQIWRHGQQQDVADADAVLLLATGLFSLTPGASVQLPISQAALASTVGVQGVIYELSDGDSAGAKLSWGVPAGGSAATWVWWVWPQAAFL